MVKASTGSASQGASAAGKEMSPAVPDDGNVIRNSNLPGGGAGKGQLIDRRRLQSEDVVRVTIRSALNPGLRKLMILCPLLLMLRPMQLRLDGSQTPVCQRLHRLSGKGVVLLILTLQ